jgi:hypothetical protein
MDRLRLRPFRRNFRDDHEISPDVLETLFPACVASVRQGESKHLRLCCEFWDICGVESVLEEQGLPGSKRLAEGKGTEERKIGKAADKLELCDSNGLRHCGEPECSHAVVVGAKRDNLNLRAIMPAFLRLPPGIIVGNRIQALWQRARRAARENMIHERIGEANVMHFQIMSKSAGPLIIAIRLIVASVRSAAETAKAETCTRDPALPIFEILHHLGLECGVLTRVHKTDGMGPCGIVVTLPVANGTQLLHGLFYLARFRRLETGPAAKRGGKMARRCPMFKKKATEPTEEEQEGEEIVFTPDHPLYDKSIAVKEKPEQLGNFLSAVSRHQDKIAKEKAKAARDAK